MIIIMLLECSDFKVSIISPVFNTHNNNITYMMHIGEDISSHQSIGEEEGVQHYRAE